MMPLDRKSRPIGAAGLPEFYVPIIAPELASTMQASVAQMVKRQAELGAVIRPAIEQMGRVFLDLQRTVQPAFSQMARTMATKQLPDLSALPNPPVLAVPIITPVKVSGASELGSLVRKSRKRMKMNQQYFADAAGVGRRFLSELENGKPSLEFDKVIACALAAGIDIFAKPRRLL